MLSKRYAAASEELWNPQVVGATRPGSGSPWDYQTAVYNPHLVRGGEEKGQPYLVYNPHLVRGGGGKRGGLGGGDEAVGDQRKRCSWPGLVCAGCRSRAGCYATHA